MRYLVPIFALAGIATVEVVAIHHGVNGVLLSLALVTMAGIGGYKLARTEEPKK